MTLKKSPSNFPTPRYIKTGMRKGGLYLLAAIFRFSKLFMLILCMFQLQQAHKRHDLLECFVGLLWVVYDEVVV